MLRVPFLKQEKEYTCGPAALAMVLRFLGDYKSERTLAKLLHTDPAFGTSHLALIRGAQQEGFYCYVNTGSTLAEVAHFIGLGYPVIVHSVEPSGEEGHYAVVVGFRRGKIVLNDSSNGKNFVMSRREFEGRWHREGKEHWMMVVSQKDFALGKQYYPLNRHL